MHWKTWLKEMCPKEWTNTEVLKFIDTCWARGIKPTLQDIERERP